MPTYTTIQSDFSGGQIDEICLGSFGSELFSTSLAEAKNVLFSQSGAVFRRQGTEMVIKGRGIRRLFHLHHGKQNNEALLLFSRNLVSIFELRTKVLASTATDLDEDAIDSMSLTENQGIVYGVSQYHRPFTISLKQSDTSGNSVASFSFTNYKDTTSTFADPEPPSQAVYVGSDKVVGLDAPVSEAVQLVFANIHFVYGDIDLSEQDENGKFFVSEDEIADTPAIDFARPGNWPKVQAFKGGRWILGSTDTAPNTIWASRPFSADGKARYYDFTYADKYIDTITLTRTITKLYSKDSTTVFKSESQYDLTSTSKTTGAWFYGDKASAKIPDPQQEIAFNTETNAPYVREDADVIPTFTTGPEGIQDENGNKGMRWTYKWVYKQYDATVLSDHAIILNEVEMSGGTMNWMTSEIRLVVGYGRSVWMDAGTVITPEAFDLQKALALTNSSVEPASYGGLLFVAGGDGRQVFAVSYSTEAGGFSMQDITVAARSLFKAKVKKLVVAEGWTSILFALLEDGSLLACTLGLSRFGWSSMDIGSEVQSIDLMKTSTFDIVYLLTERGGTQMVESFVPNRQDEAEDFSYMDCMRTFTISERKLPVLESYYPRGAELQVVMDGTYYGNVFVGREGDFVFPDDVTPETVSVGYPYESAVTTLTQNIPANGSSVMKSRLISEQWVSIHKTNSFTVATVGDPGGGSEAKLYGTTDYGDSGGLRTGSFGLELTSLVRRTMRERFACAIPYPFCLVGLATVWAIKEA